MPDGSAIVLLYDDTFEGLLSAVFQSYSYHPAPEAVESRSLCQQRLGRRYVEAAASEEQAERVIAGIRKIMGREAYEKVWTVFQSAFLDKGDAVYRYIRLGMRIGRAIHQKITDPWVMRVDKICSLVGREAGMLRQFVRFSKLEGGVYYGEISPEHFVLPLLMPHFYSRFQIQPFLIYDKTHRQAGVSDTKTWYITSAEELRLPELAEDDAAYRRMWKAFYETIAIQQRINPVCQRNHMPKKYWKHLTEMQFQNDDPDKESRIALPSELSARRVRRLAEAGQTPHPLASLSDTGEPGPRDGLPARPLLSPGERTGTVSQNPPQKF